MHVDKLSIFDQNCVFIGAQYVDFELPKDLMFLKKYFKTKIQKQFLNYYLCMTSYAKFPEHVGVEASRAFCFKMAKKCDYLLDAIKKAKENMDLDAIALLHSKKYPLPKNLYP